VRITLERPRQLQQVARQPQGIWFLREGSQRDDYGDFEGSVREIGGPTASELGAIEIDA
jgi:hypothetical protein